LQARLPVFRWGAGGPLGSGRQWWPWIHIDDLVALFLFALDREQMRGAVNAVSPDIATNARFSHAFGHALRRPALVPAPAFASANAPAGDGVNATLSPAKTPAIPAVRGHTVVDADHWNGKVKPPLPLARLGVCG